MLNAFVRPVLAMTVASVFASTMPMAEAHHLRHVRHHSRAYYHHPRYRVQEQRVYVPTRVCIPSCPEDTLPCDPIYFKIADGRCTNPFRG